MKGNTRKRGKTGRQDYKRGENGQRGEVEGRKVTRKEKKVEDKGVK